MKKRSLIISSIIILILTTSCQSGLSFSKTSQINEKTSFLSDTNKNPSALLNTQSTDCRERYAIHKAETINYSSFTNLPRYSDLWANYIDQDVVNHYYLEYSKVDNNETVFYEKQKLGSKFPVNISGDRGILARVNYSAQARCHQIIDIHKEFYATKKMNSAYQFNLTGDPEHFAVGVIAKNVQFRIANLSTSYYFLYKILAKLSNVIVVDMRLKYNEAGSFLSGYLVDTNQRIIFDEDYNVLMMFFSPSHQYIA